MMRLNYSIYCSFYYRYDISALANEYSITDSQNQKYSLAICTPSKTCPNTSGICSISNDQENSLGQFNTKLKINATGSPFLEYNSGVNCGEDKKFSTRIEFICAENKSNSVNPIIVEKDDCHLIIQIETNKVCPIMSAQCHTFDEENNIIYDLTSLRNNNKNYRAVFDKSRFNNLTSDTVFLINVCRSLVPEFGVSCASGSAACYGVNHENKTIEQELSLGFYDTSLTLGENKIPQLIYLRGDVCPTDHHTNLSAIIDFICDPIAGYGEPRLEDIIEQCQFKFIWKTNLICHKHNCEFRKPTCDIFNGQTNNTFNLKLIKFNYINHVSFIK